MLSGELLSVGVTSFDAVSTIEAAVRSALGQSWSPLEVVVVDDGSTDGTREVLQRLAGSDDRLRCVFHGQNRGVAAARNTILQHAKGEAVAFFDDDDISHPDRLRC